MSLSLPSVLQTLALSLASSTQAETEPSRQLLTLRAELEAETQQAKTAAAKAMHLSWRLLLAGQVPPRHSAGAPPFLCHGIWHAAGRRQSPPLERVDHCAGARFLASSKNGQCDNTDIV